MGKWCAPLLSFSEESRLAYWGWTSYTLGAEVNEWRLLLVLKTGVFCGAQHRARGHSAGRSHQRLHERALTVTGDHSVCP